MNQLPAQQTPYEDLHKVFLEACTLSNKLFKTCWAIGGADASPRTGTNSGGPGAPTAAQRQELAHWQGGPR